MDQESLISRLPTTDSQRSLEHEFLTTTAGKPHADSTFTPCTLSCPSACKVNQGLTRNTQASKPTLAANNDEGNHVVGDGTLSQPLENSPQSHSVMLNPIIDRPHPPPPPLRSGSIISGPSSHPARPVWRIWGFEVISISLSYFIFTAIVVVLANHDQKQLPNWPLKITLNSFLAFLTTLAKAAFMWPVSNAISQAQWSWFLQDRPLYDFHLIDQASRGSWGSLALLWRVRHKHFVTLAAFLSIICVLTSPLTQLAIDYPSRYVPSPDPDGAQISAIGVLKKPDESLVVATTNTLNQLPWPVQRFDYELASPTGAVCSTGNCTFDEIHSLGICVDFADVSSKLKIQPIDDPAELANLGSTWYVHEGPRMWNGSLPNAYPDGRSLDLLHQGKLAFVLDILTGNESIAFRDDKNLMHTKIASLVLIRTVPVFGNQVETNWEQVIKESTFAQILDAITEVRYEATEILFHLCVQSYHTSVNRGKQNTTMINSTATPTNPRPDFFMDFTCNGLAHDDILCDPYRPEVITRYNETIYLDGPVNASAVPGLERYGATYESMEIIARELKTTMMSFGQEDPQRSFVERPDDVYLDLFLDASSRPLWTSIFLDHENLIDPVRTIHRIKTIFRNLAIGLSSGLRENRPRYRVTDDVYNITGTAWVEESYVSISWGWLTFLAVELVMATVFLVLTIIAQIKMRARSAAKDKNYTSVVEDYKDSYLAPLLALSQEARSAAGGGLRPMSVMKETAKRVYVRLEGDEVVPASRMEQIA